MAYHPSADELINENKDVLEKVAVVKDGLNLLCSNPAYRDVLSNSQEKNKCDSEPENNFNAKLEDLDQNANGFSVSEIDCNEEDKDAAGFIQLTETNSKSRVPQLVFLDSDDNSSTEQLCPNHSDLITKPFCAKTELERSEDGCNSNRLLNGIGNLNDLSLSQKSVSSQQSSDSDLITDHCPENMSPNEDSAVVFSGRHKDWHCHDTTLKLASDKTARNQLLAVSILCFVFMIGESVGKNVYQLIW